MSAAVTTTTPTKTNTNPTPTKTNTTNRTNNSSSPGIFKSISSVFTNFYKKMGQFSVLEYILLIIHVVLISLILELLIEYISKFF